MKYEPFSIAPHSSFSLSVSVCLCQVFWDRALGMPLERPKSVTPEYIVQYFADQEDTDKSDEAFKTVTD
jgi:hypothetical protein